MSLLLPIAKDAVLRKLGDRVRKLDRSYVVRWLDGEFWLVDTLGPKYAGEMRAWKSTVMDTLESITTDEVLDACRSARPDLSDLWDTPRARERIGEEWTKGKAFVEEL